MLMIELDADAVDEFAVVGRFIEVVR